MNLQKDQPIVVIGHRYNPQLGEYLTGPYIGKVKRLNKLSFSVKLDRDYVPSTFDFGGWTIRQTKSIYGSMTYRAYTVADAIALLTKEIDKYEPKCPKAIALKEAVDRLSHL